MVSDWTFPADVPGWLTVGEGRTLAALAAEKDVLEIGSYCGRSTICIAQMAERVVSVDWHQGDAGSGFGDTEAAFLANLERYGVSERVAVHVCRSEDFSSEERFDLVFVDGAHDYASVVTDLRVALRHLRAGGVIAMHDWDYPQVRQAHRDILGSGWRVSTVERLSCSRKLALSADKPRVFVGMPRHSESASFSAVKAFCFPSAGACEVVEQKSTQTSLLDQCFNQVWAQALDARESLDVTHFAMIHSDVAPDMGWLDVLLGELGNADMVSAIIPIKNSCGLTSTALDTGDLWLPRRLTMTEVMELPETFGPEDVGYPLLLNTGLWVCDLRRPWADEVCFDSLQRIVKTAAGKRVAQCVPEDWFFSHCLNERGCRLKATRKVALAHCGERLFTNNHAWGLWKTDELYQKAHESKPLPAGEQVCASSS